jgi:hypothetical protein
MAIRALDGDVPIFYWGGLYGGSQEALAAAAVFAFTGADRVALKLVGLSFYAVAGVLVWLVGRRTVGEPGARIGAALFAVWPPFLVWWSTKERGFYGSGLLVGLLGMWLALRLRERDSRLDAALLGLALGVGVWATLQSMLLALPALVWLALRRPQAYRLAPYALPGLVAGASPWLAWNVRHGWNAVVPESTAGAGSTYLERFGDLFAIVLPTWLGLREPYTLAWVPGRAAGVALLVLALGLLMFLCVRFRREAEPLLLALAAFPFLYAASTFTYFVDEPRYLVFLAPVPALLAGAGLARTTPLAAAAALALAVAASVVGLARLEREGRYAPLRVPSDLGPVLETLERNGVRHVRANYWIAYRITFESEERVIASPDGFWRYYPYHQAVSVDPRPGRVFLSGSARGRREQPRLIEAGYRRLSVDGFVVYVPRR